MRNLNGGIIVSKYFLTGFILTIVINVFLDSKYSHRFGKDSLLLSSELQKISKENPENISHTLLKSSERHRPNKLSEEILFSGVICVHTNHFTPFLNRTLKEYALEIRPVPNYLSSPDCHLLLVVLERSYATIKEIKLSLQSHSFHSIKVIEETSFIIIRSDYRFALNLNANVFRPISESDYRDFESLEEWYKELNEKRPTIKRPRYETSLLPWTYFNQTHLYSAETDIVTAKPIGHVLKYQIQSLLDMAGEDPETAIQRGWYQFIPEWGINLVLLLRNNGKIIKGFKEKTEDPIMIPMPFVTESQTIHWVSPLFTRDKWKIPSISNIRTNSRHNIHRHIIYDFNGIETNNKRFTTYQMRNMSEMSMFDMLAKVLPNIIHHPTYDSEALIFYSCVPQLNPTRNFLNRIRLNALQGKQIFNPIPHVRYKLTSSTTGFFDSDNWEFVGFYAKDFASMVDTVLSQRNRGIHLLRVPEPDLSLTSGIPKITDGIQHIGERSALEKYILDYIQKHSLLE